MSSRELVEREHNKEQKRKKSHRSRSENTITTWHVQMLYKLWKQKSCSKHRLIFFNRLKWGIAETSITCETKKLQTGHAEEEDLTQVWWRKECSLWYWFKTKQDGRFAYIYRSRNLLHTLLANRCVPMVEKASLGETGVRRGILTFSDWHWGLEHISLIREGRFQI